jgi:hypothetical protein
VTFLVIPMIDIIDDDKVKSKLDELIRKSVPAKDLGYVKCNQPSIMLPAINVGPKFLLRLGNAKGADVIMENSCFSIERKFFWQLHLEWPAKKIQKCFVFDVLPNLAWLTFLSNTRTFALTSHEFSNGISVSNITTDALEIALKLAQMLPRNPETW